MSGVREAVFRAVEIRKAFGGNQAVAGVSLALAPSELMALVGPNGAGKTTCLNLLSGQIPVDGGTIELAGTDVTRVTPSSAARRSLFRSFQNGGTFARLTAVENVAVTGLVRGMGRPQAEAEARQALARVGLGPVADWEAEHLSGGQRKLIDFARLMLARPAVALLDEPTAGVNPAIMEVMRALILDLRRTGTAFVVISHDLPWVFGLCSRVVVMAAGRVLASGSPEEVSANEQVREAYLA